MSKYTIAFSLCALYFLSVSAQTMSSTNIINSSESNSTAAYEAPDWAPVAVAEVQTRHYYFPDLGMYYDLKSKMFIFKQNLVWTFSPRLPLVIFGEIDLKLTNVIPLANQDQWPYKRFETHTSKYPSGYKHIATN